MSDTAYSALGEKNANRTQTRAACRRTTTGGFTIVEVMIVLAVSGLLLISAAALINGRQARTEFTTGINDEQQQIEQIINETSSGYYPNGGDFSCSGSLSGPVTILPTPHGSKGQGTNGGCMFIGKAVQFGTGNASPDYSTLFVLPLVGEQYQNSGGNLTPTLTVKASVPRAVYPAVPTEVGNVPTDAATSDLMEYGLRVANGNNKCGSPSYGMCYLPAGGGSYAQTGMAAFIAGDSNGNVAAAATGSSVNLQSGSQQLSLYGVSGSAQNTSPIAAAGSIGSLSRTALNGLGNLDPAKEVLICLASGGTNQSGLLTISGNGSLSVTLQIMGDTTC